MFILMIYPLPFFKKKEKEKEKFHVLFK